MNRIIFPLEPGMHGPQVVNLQGALHLLLDRAAILAGDAATRNDLSLGLRRERAETIYEQVTRRIVTIFQEERQEQRLEPHGRVDEPTANALNVMLEELGAFDEPRAFVVRGQVRFADGLACGRVHRDSCRSRPAQRGTAGRGDDSRGWTLRSLVHDRPVSPGRTETIIG